MHKIVLNLSSILICLIPISLLTGPFLPDLFVCIVGISIFFIIIKDKKWNYINNNFSIFLIVFYLYLLLSSFLSSSIIESLESSLFYFRFGLFALSLSFLIDHKENFRKLFFYSLLLSFIICLLAGYYQYLFQESIFGYQNEDETRLFLPFDDRMILGGYLSRLFPLLIALFFVSTSTNVKHYLIIGLLLILTDVLIYLSGERTALVLLFVSTVSILFLLSRFKILRAVTFAISVAVIVAITFINDDIRERNIDTTIQQIGIGSDKINAFSPQHENMFITSWKIFKERPIIGSGPNLFRFLCGEARFDPNPMSCSTHPHNTYIQLISETGLIGLSLFLIYAFYVSLKLVSFIYNLVFYNIRTLSDYQICLLICMFITVFPFVPTHDFFNNWINVIYYLPLGFYINSIYYNKEKRF